MNYNQFLKVIDYIIDEESTLYLKHSGDEDYQQLVIQQESNQETLNNVTNKIKQTSKDQ